MSLRKVLAILTILAILTGISPVSFAQQATKVPQYGSIAGKVVDKNGDPVSGVVVEAQDNYYKLVSTFTTGEDGKFFFENLPVISSDGYDNYRLVAKLTKDGREYIPVKTIFFRVYSLQCTSQDITLYDYPPSGKGLLYGTVSSYNNRLSPIPGVVYFNNGIYIHYGGGKDEQWQMNLPEGDYEVWAECNKDGATYISGKYKVHVTSDGTFYQMIYLPTNSEPAAYHEQPGQQSNKVGGTVTQKNGVPLDNVYVELCTVSGKDGYNPVMYTRTDDQGKYQFKDIIVNTVSENYAVRFTYDQNGKQASDISGTFPIYYANTLGVPHDIEKSFQFGFVDTGSLTIDSYPAGASIWIDGEPANHITPFTFDPIKTGYHEISLMKDGYFDENFTYEVMPELQSNVSKNLKQCTGGVYFDVTPDDAAVYINGEYAGKGDINISNKQYGKYTYVVVRDEYRNATGSFDVYPGDVSTIHVNMVAVPGISVTYLMYLLNNMAYSIGKMFSS